MLFSYIWGNNTNTIGNEENNNPNSASQRPLKTLNYTDIHQFNKSTNLRFGRLRHRDSALLIMRLACTNDDRLCGPQSVFDTKEYLKLLDKIESADFTQSSFSTKHIIAIEGLSGTGKTTLATQLKSSFPHIQVLKRRSPPAIFHSLPKCLQIAFAYLETYHLALQIMEDTTSNQREAGICLVEDYYHHFLANNMAVNDVLDTTTLPVAASAWPLDLPMPELVLFLTTTTNIRLSRLTQATSSYSNNSSKAPPIIVGNEEQDKISSTLYAMIRGPCTVGIDTSSEDQSIIYHTVIEALDYFGVYAISRAIPTISQEENIATVTPEQQQVAVPVAASEQHHQPSSSSSRPSSLAAVATWQEPIMSNDVIINRRISAGVYGMYARMYE